MRTFEDTKDRFIPVEKCIRDTFILAILGRSVSDIHRRMFTLPVKFGRGLSIVNTVEMAHREYQTSIRMTEELVGPSIVMRQH